ncbi:MAG TPA: hypothetical protein VFE25_13000, partial [Opitutaceae bacterium]|nr:hypothetical protein [Opitutaceae bacterium]
PRLPVKSASLALLLLAPKRLIYRNNAISLTHEGAGYTYVDPEGEFLAKLQDNAELLGYFNPADPKELFLSTLEGQYAGALTLLGGKRGGVPIQDTEALDEARAVRAKIVNRDVAAVRARHPELEAELGGMRAHNDKILAAHRASTLPPAPAAIPSANSRELSPSQTGTAEPVAVSLEDSVAGRRARISEARTQQRSLLKARSEVAELLDEPAAGATSTNSLSADDLL